MKTSNQYAEEFSRELISHTNPQKAKWLENYVKHGIKSRGVPIPEIRKLLEKFIKEHSINSKPLKVQLEFINTLMENTYTDEKLAAILFIQLYWNETDPGIQLKTISSWFDKKWVFDWNVCDWLCVKVLNRLIDKYADIATIEMRKWNKSDYLWKARASLVSFVYSESLKKEEKLIYEFSTNLIKRDERFAKTSVGWILREYSKIDEKFVTAFLNKNIKHFTIETVNNSLKYFSKDFRKTYLTKVK